MLVLKQLEFSISTAFWQRTKLTSLNCLLAKTDLKRLLCKVSGHHLNSHTVVLTQQFRDYILHLLRLFYFRFTAKFTLWIRYLLKDTKSNLATSFSWHCGLVWKNTAWNNDAKLWTSHWFALLSHLQGRSFSAPKRQCTDTRNEHISSEGQL